MSATNLFACLRFDWVSGHYAWVTFAAPDWDAARTVATPRHGFEPGSLRPASVA